MANELPDGFNRASGVMKEKAAIQKDAINAPVAIAIDTPANETTVQQRKRGRPKGSKDTVPRKSRKTAEAKKSDVTHESSQRKQPVIGKSAAPDSGLGSVEVLSQKENSAGPAVDAAAGGGDTPAENVQSNCVSLEYVPGVGLQD
ncbi:hypothetical protein DFS34DRAFT_593330 [Phlyctochytrium arcticum]|nr:hypothetical protein DFS34DRAFT_593330 [Phlyctochytrium arcticum]